MEYANTTVEELSAVLTGLPAFVRAGLERHEDGWALRTCHAVVGQKPPHWSPAVWEYASVVLVACEMPSDELAGLFAPEGTTTELAAREVRVGAVHDGVSVQRQPSRAPHDMVPLPWPSTDFAISAQSQPTGQGPQGFLVGDGDCPSFPDYHTAFYAFFYGRSSNIGAHTIPTELARIRLVHTAAWLERVRVSPSRLTVRVRGDAHEGARLELNGETLRTSKKVGKTGIVTLNLPSGLPDDAYLYLSRERRWLDYRVLGARLSGPSVGRDGGASGVTVELPDDTESRVQALLVAGEGPHLEFKSALPGTTVEAKRKVFKTVAAFANGAGGTVVFGVDPDELTLTGIDGADDPVARDRLGNLIRGIVVPTPDFYVESARVDGSALVVLTVSAGTTKPYGVQFGNKPVEFYVRRGASTYPATHSEVRSAALTTAETSEASAMSWRLR